MTENFVGRSSSGGVGLGRGVNFSGLPESRPRAHSTISSPRTRIFAAFARGPAKVSSRCSQREAVAGASPARAEWVSTIRCCPNALMKSCAASPISRSGGSRSSPPFIMRDMKRSGSARRGQLPSLSPPTTSVPTALQTGFQRAPDRDAAVAAGRWLDDLRRDQGGCNIGPFVARDWKVVAVGDQRAKEAGKLFAGVAFIEPGRATRSSRASPSSAMMVIRAISADRHRLPAAAGGERRTNGIGKPGQDDACFVEICLADPPEPLRLAVYRGKAGLALLEACCTSAAMSGRPVPPRSATSSIVSGSVPNLAALHPQAAGTDASAGQRSAPDRPA